MLEAEIPIHGPEVGTLDVQTPVSVDLPRGVTMEDLRPPEAESFKPGDTLFVMQVNAKDVRNPTDGEIGELYPDGANELCERTTNFFNETIEGIPEGERQKLKIIIISSDAPLITPIGVNSEHRRAFDTASRVIDSVASVLDKYKMPADILSSNPILFKRLRDLNMLHDTDDPNSVAFLHFMTNKYGTGHEMWAAYEDDTEKETREKYGVEGPHEIADRVEYSVKLMKRLADSYLRGHPDHRVVVWSVSHYDNLSPFIKDRVLAGDTTKLFLPMNKGSGIVLHQESSGRLSTTVDGHTFTLEDAQNEDYKVE